MSFRLQNKKLTLFKVSALDCNHVGDNVEYSDECDETVHDPSSFL